VPPGRRGHAETVRGSLVGPRAGAEAGAIGRLGDPFAGIEPVAEAAEPVRLTPLARRRAGDLLEDAVEMEPADAGGIGKLGEARDLVTAADQGAGAGDRGDVPVGRRTLIRAAALARPEPGRFRGGGSFVERDVLAARLARGTA